MGGISSDKEKNAVREWQKYILFAVILPLLFIINKSIFCDSREESFKRQVSQHGLNSFPPASHTRTMACMLTWRLVPEKLQNRSPKIFFFFAKASLHAIIRT